MKWDGTRHGRGGAVGDSAALKEAWGRVGELPDGDVPGEWVPWMAVWIKDGVSPRAINSETVDRYAENFAAIMSTAPIRVQRGTFALIDGRHRLEAAPKASSDFVRIVEVDVSDDDLPLMAFEANIGHGLGYTLSERVAGAKLMLRHYPQMTPTELARRTGLSYDSANKYRNQYLTAAGAKPPESILRKSDSANLARDNNERPAAPRPTPITRVPEPEWVEPATDDDDWPTRPIPVDDDWAEPEESRANPPARSENRVEGGVKPGISDPWLSHRKEGPWLDDLIRLAERYPFESIADLAKAISDHPEPKRCRNAFGILGLLYEDMGVLR